MSTQYDRASKDPSVWQRLDARQAQDAVLAAIREGYPAAVVGAETRTNPDGSVTSTVYAADEPYPWILSFREAHEKYFRDHSALDRRQHGSLPYPEYVKWSLEHNRNAWIDVNKKLANERLTRLKKECRESCAGGCCGR